MGYNVKVDDNGFPIQDGLERIHTITLSTGTLGEQVVTLPGTKVFSVVIKKLPVLASMRINGYPDLVPIEEGEGYGTFANLRELVINVEQVGTENIVLLLFV